MACCYIAAFCVGQLVKTCQFLDLDQTIQYNDERDPTIASGKAQDDTRDGGPESYNDNTDQTSVILSIDGMTCSTCVQTVNEALELLDEVKEVRTSLQTNESVVLSTGKHLDNARLIDVVRETGYEARLGSRTHSEVLELLQLKKDLALLRASFSGLARYGASLQLLASTGSIAGRWSSESFAAATWVGVVRLSQVLITVISQY
ncbi:hypothetical protein PV08_06564 [Exophiala spinifera]|uniref:HMA domain-containing protein n=1 Tax=Exophiala spinifera TaxID=91928 RepID=A0A0D2BYZ7_9EURO|nr:uncharacterized protein PV08_06564 [Exophiala spinifera]KIW16509.1 hypothetical protein PV08_06564 [Exophiala spinifera]